MRYFLKQTYTLEELSKEYRKLAKTLHPDVSIEEDAEAQFKLMIEEFTTLKNMLTKKPAVDYAHVDVNAVGRALAELLKEVLEPIPMVSVVMSIQGNNVIVNVRTGRFKRIKTVFDAVTAVVENAEGNAYVAVDSEKYPKRYVYKQGPSIFLTKGMDHSVALIPGALNLKYNGATWLYMSNRRFAYAYNKRTGESYTYEGKLEDLKKTIY